MKNKVFIPILCVLLVLLGVYTYLLKNETNQQALIVEQQLKTIDSLKLIMETKISKEKLMREKTERIIAKSQNEADSLRRIKH